MTSADRREIIALIDAMPEDRQHALLALLRQLSTCRPRTPWSWSDGPLSQTDADQMIRDIEEAFGRQEPETEGYGTSQSRPMIP